MTEAMKLEAQALAERLESHMGMQDQSVLLTDCHAAAKIIRAMLQTSPVGAGDRSCENLEVALQLAVRGRDQEGCDSWRAQEMCRQIVPLLQALSSTGARP